MTLKTGRKGLTSPMSPTLHSFSEQGMPPGQGQSQAGAPGGPSASSSSSMAMGGAPSSSQQSASDHLSKVPQFASLGSPFKSTLPVQLTEAETEFSVKVIKHIFQNCIVLEYVCVNTLPDTLLENVHVTLKIQGANIRQVDAIPAAAMETDVPTPFYAVLETLPGTFPVATISNVLQYVIKEKDPHTNAYDEQGYQDQYQVLFLCFALEAEWKAHFFFQKVGGL